MENNIKVYVENANGELTIRTGEAVKPLALMPPIQTNLIGVLDTPLKWLEKRQLPAEEQLKAYVRYSNDSKKISLYINEADPYTAGLIEGSLMKHKDKPLWQINEGHVFTNFQLASLIKMNRSAFESNQVAMELVTLLRNFNAKVNAEIEKADNKRGDVKLLRTQTVESNLPDAFRISVGVFKGYTKKSVSVEVEIDPDTLNCSLVSPDYKELEDVLTENEIEKVLEEIRAIAPGIAIIEY